MENTDNETSDSNTSQSAGGLFASFNFSNNLVEVGALTALVGSSVAESLVLGNRGAAGIAWAPTSSFGTISVIKACFCGASSGWLRETLGIRTASSDLAVGLELPHDSKRAAKVRRNIGDPLAIFCHASQRDAGSGKGHTPRRRKVACSDVYALDHSTALMLRTIPDNAPGNPMQVFTYANYRHYRLPSRFQVPAICLSCSKLFEIYYMWKHDALILGLASATPWAFFFIAAVVIQIHEFLQSRHPEVDLGSLDIITGQLPMVSRRGGPRKLVLGAAENPRSSFHWRGLWAVGALVSTASTILSYVVMGDQPRSVVFTWAGFQILWLGVRILVHHFADAVNPMASRILAVRPWTTLPAQLKERVIDLTFALAQCQADIHPRGPLQYTNDSFSGNDLTLISDGIRPPNLYPLPDLNPSESSSLPVEIKAIFGDTSLSSAMWMTGAYTTPMDLYDSCIVVFTIRQSNHAAAPRRSVAVPAARVLAGASMTFDDTEKTMPNFVPKGAPNLGYGITWCYWIPCRTGLWLQIKIPSPTSKTVGVHQADVLTDAELSTLLSAGTLNIGLKDIDEVKAVVELSRKARESFLELLS